MAKRGDPCASRCGRRTILRPLLGLALAPLLVGAPRAEDEVEKADAARMPPQPGDHFVFLSGYPALAFAALCAVSPTAVADEIGSWHFGTGKDGPPAESGSMISLANDEDDRLFIRCSNNAYRLAVMHIADPAPTAINPKVRIDVDNNNWVEGDAKIDGT
jgi:hypothetical protein